MMPENDQFGREVVGARGAKVRQIAIGFASAGIIRTKESLADALVKQGQLETAAEPGFPIVERLRAVLGGR